MLIKTDTFTESGESGERYAVLIPADTTIPWGSPTQKLVYNVESHLGYGKYLNITVSGNSVMKCDSNNEPFSVLPYTLAGATTFTADRPTVYPSVEKTIMMNISDDAWNNVPIDEYYDTLTFTASVV